jgi:hypothetical protein
MTRIIALVVALAARTQAFVQPQPPRTTSSSLHATPFLLPARARPSRFPRSRELKTVARELTTISRDPTLATSVSTAGAALVAWHSVVGAAYWRGSFVLDLPFLVFSLFLFLQTYRTRFVFDASAFEVTKRNLDGAPLATDNFAVGGRSRWDQGRKRVIQRRLNVSFPRAHVSETAPTLRERSER